MIAPHRPPAASYGTDDFAAHLAAREQRLGLAAGITQATQDVTQVDRATGQCDGDTDDPDAAPPEPPMGDMGDMGDMGADEKHDRWRNEYLTPPGLLGQYTIRSQWHRDGRVIYVCGQPGAHARAGHWRFDARTTAGRWQGQGYICAMCFCIESGMYGGYERVERKR